ncbi:poly-beta-1,6-N-acetyl-D-glucosamine N-deacetylase PgaB [Sandaracinobacter sp.]|uniref:poly-beta-1,6-N-acetyl-D-glucosamine N-deacetylase PgaB n=1 Tax=Sandaracinobacter sp. TaxID=2487581 RepID=UPI0035B48B8E
MRTLLILLLLLVAGPLMAEAPDGGTRFAAIAFHDVVDSPADLVGDAVTAQSLVDFFDWLKAEGWTPVSLAQVAAAGQGGPPLPPRAILLSFDDGYKSFHDRVYPLLLAYNYPAVLGLVSGWLDVPAGGTVDFGGTPVPRAHFISWDEVRRMKASGLVEMASHTHDMHRVVQTTPQGNTGPADRSWAFDPATGRYEDDAAHRARIRADLIRSRDRIAAETGVPPRAIVWPFGRFSGPAAEEARAAGYEFALTLEPELADVTRPMELHRYYPTQDPSLGVIAFNLGFPQARAETVRLACVDISPLAGLSGDAQDQRLGQMVEAVRALGPTGVVLDLGPGGEGMQSAWLPNAVLPVSDDIFGRAARQFATRAGVNVYARLPAGHPHLDDAALAGLAASAAKAAPIDGLVIAGGAHAEQPPASAPSPADLRAARQAAGDRAVRLFAPAAAIDPRLSLLTAGQWGPAPTAERRLQTDGPGTAALAGAGWMAPANSGRVVLAVPGGTPAGQRAAVREAQRAGATAFLTCPFDPATAARLAPFLSSATFPYVP